ncbi:MAG: hemin receptor [Prevotella sp.]|nr:hemin receptor [Prevotella sp.]
MKLSHYYIWGLMAMMSWPVMAQDTYTNANIETEDLNGTARYVGMGGAMDALGADISTIGSNPAGLGLFRRSQIAVSFGMVSQADCEKAVGGDKTHASFDQLGFVYAMRTGSKSFLNFGVSYRKTRDYNFILNAMGNLNGSSQNKQTYDKIVSEAVLSKDDASFSQLDNLYHNNLVYNTTDDMFYYYPANRYRLDRAAKGYTGNYDFSISGNIRDRVYLGLTFGVKDVNYKHYGEYTEWFGENLDNIESVTISDNREINGTGFDVKAGIIVRPIENSPFRFGFSVATPTWYDLTTNNTTNYNEVSPAKYAGRSGQAYDFKFYSPWKFGFSLGHTIGNFLALGASYEYADYSETDTRINDGFYDYWDGYYENSHSDRDMNRHTENTLKGVSTLKLGIEYKPVPELAIRMGYNYVSPMYEENAQQGVAIWSPGTYHSSTTDFTNWKSTNRFTCGLGYTIDQFNLDLAYQYSAQNGDFRPFTSTTTNPCSSVEVSNKRSQVLLTLGYRF